MNQRMASMRAACSLHSRLVASESALPEVYTTAEPPFSIVFANRAWESLCGWKAQEVIGMTCAILQGKRTCKRVLHQLAAAVAAGLPFDGVLINYTRPGAPFTNHLTLEPLCLGPTSPGRITHYVGTLRASPCCMGLSHEPQLSARFDGMYIGKDAQAPIQTNSTCDEGSQSLACRLLATELLATNGFAPVSLPQLLTAMTSLLPVEPATALIELVGAVLRNEIVLCAAQFHGALRILLGVHISILTDLVGWLTLLAPEPAGCALLSDVGESSLESAAPGKVGLPHIGSRSIDDITTPGLNLS